MGHNGSKWAFGESIAFHLIAIRMLGKGCSNMGDIRNNANDNELELGKFGKYLLVKRLVPERNAKFFVQWVRRFLNQLPTNGGLGLQDRLQVFLDDTRKCGAEDWQVSQAERAVRLFFQKS